MQEIVRLINESGLSKSAIARRAGVSTSTVTRIVAGELDPTIGTATRLINALGYQFPSQMPRLCDTRAVHAARSLIMEEQAEGYWVETLDRWACTISDLVLTAGQAAPILQRPETVSIRTSWSPLRIFGAVSAAGTRYVASGWAAAVAYGVPDATQNPLVIYVDGGAAALGLALTNDPNGGREVCILPFDGVSEQGAQVSDGVSWADSYQVVLDLCADHRTEELGLRMLSRLEESRG